MHVVLITTGGTIASRHDPAGGGVVASVGAAELRRRAGVPAGLDLRVDEFCNVGSFLIGLDLAHRLAARINEHAADPDCAGIVVTHGTDTMEESAWLADLLLEGDAPVVFTGAQRNADEPDSDGPRNLRDALTLAASPLARGLGAMVLFEQEFHAARDVSKTHASRTDTFTSGEHGALGAVDEGRVAVRRRPVRLPSLPAAGGMARVDLIKLGLGQDGGLLRFSVADGARGLVLEAFGRGNAPADVTAAAIQAIRAGIAVVVTSRCPRGRVLPVYGNGGGVDLAAAGAIFAGDLAGVKARLLLSALLGLDLAAAEVSDRMRLAGD